jgi:hypothetical protein
MMFGVNNKSFPGFPNPKVILASWKKAVIILSLSRAHTKCQLLMDHRKSERRVIPVLSVWLANYGKRRRKQVICSYAYNFNDAYTTSGVQGLHQLPTPGSCRAKPAVLYLGFESL